MCSEENQTKMWVITLQYQRFVLPQYYHLAPAASHLHFLHPLKGFLAGQGQLIIGAAYSFDESYFRSRSFGIHFRRSVTQSLLVLPNNQQTPEKNRVSEVEKKSPQGSHRNHTFEYLPPKIISTMRLRTGAKIIILISGLVHLTIASPLKKSSRTESTASTFGLRSKHRSGHEQNPASPMFYTFLNSEEDRKKRPTPREDAPKVVEDFLKILGMHSRYKLEEGSTCHQDPKDFIIFGIVGNESDAWGQVIRTEAGITGFLGDGPAIEDFKYAVEKGKTVEPGEGIDVVGVMNDARDLDLPRTKWQTRIKNWWQMLRNRYWWKNKWQKWKNGKQRQEPETDSEADSDSD
ncbi:hypothetical protein F5880DRAFT_1612262 [Lentinula raphanica]|nr:hypothetical protein F5880DRAFT_1612262 [Lentinula raphanica]